MTRRAFGRLDTERRNPRTADLDRRSLPDLVSTILREDRVVPRAVARERESIARSVALIVACLGRGGRLVFCGAGTSGRLGVIEAAECPPTFGTPPALVRAIIAGGRRAVFRSVEGAEDDAAAGARELRLLEIGRHDVVVGIAASGVTPFVHGALSEAGRRKAARILVTCNRKGVDRRSADVIIAPSVGPEVITGSTRLKAGTATKLVLNTLTVAAMTRLGKVHGNLMVDVVPSNAKLRDRAERIVADLAGLPAAKARRVLAAAGGRVKIAILMGRLGGDRAEAERRLAQSAGFLRKALEAR